MKPSLFPFLLSWAWLVCMLAPGTVQAQPYAHAGEYMTALSQHYAILMEDQWQYVKAASQGKSARRVEKLRQKLLASNREVQQGISRLPLWENDASLRDSTLGFLRLCYHVIDEDYGKIVDLEAIAEDSYDLMEAYLAAKSAASDRLDQAGEKLEVQEKAFAATYQINLMEAEKTEVGQKLEAAGKVIEYHNRIYLLFFKSYKQELYLMEAVEQGNVSALMQNQSTLAKYAAEGLATLDTMAGFNGDGSLLKATRELLQFYQKEAEEDARVMAEFYLKKENMETLQKAFEAKKPKDRTQQDVDQFNQAVNDFNAAVEAFNQTNQRLNQVRNEKIDQYNKLSNKFMATHVG